VAQESQRRPGRHWGRVAAWAAAAVLVPVVLAGLYLALPYGAAAAVMRPVLNVIAPGQGLPSDLDAPAERSVVLAVDGTELATLSGEENRVTVELDAVPEQVRNAVLAIEDGDFYRHAGVNHRALARALLANLRARRIVQGGSTITQQYIKNAVLTTERTADRKTTEMRYAIELERRLPKDQILERYLNVAYFGEGVYGIATAAEYYYSKSPSDLTLDQAALLAGLISEPERTNPATEPEAAAARRDVVLRRMVEEGHASDEEARAASEQPVELSLSPLPPPDNPFFVEYVKRLLFAEEALGSTRDARQRQVFTGGLRIHTTLDPALQEAAQAAIAGVLTDPLADPLGSLVSVDPASGAIRALAVGPKEFGPCTETDEACPTTMVNPAVPGLGGSGRQPGSSFKPVLIAAALQVGVPPGWQEVTDSGQQIEGCQDEGGAWAPANFDPGDGGVKEMYEAVRVSNNVYHAKLIGLIQPEPVIDMAARMGIPEDSLPRECSLALGSASVFPVDMAAGFATLANAGVRCSPYAVERIEQDESVLRQHEPFCEEALPHDLALRVNDILRGPVEDGTGTAAQLGRPVVGKTGTTDDFLDAWFVGFVPQLVTAAWVGFEQPRPMEDVLGVARVTGGTIPAQMWAAYMETAVAELEAADFGAPPPQERLQVPDAMGRTPDEVTAGLGAYDLHVVATQVTDYRPAGTVVAQDPDPGTEVARGHFLTLEVSDGTGDPPAVPDVLGLPEGEARAALEDADYTVVVEAEQQSVTLPADGDPADIDPADGTVIRQQPAGGTPLLPGEEVTITVVRYDIKREEPPPVPTTPGPGPPPVPEPAPAPGQGPAPGPAQGAIVIAEARPRQNADAEYVLLRNDGNPPVRVGGWYLLTEANRRLDIGEGYVIAGRGGQLRVYTGSGTDRQDRYHNGLDASVLHAGGGELRLFTPDGEEVTRSPY
jgi:penicillin-binding protein 1A